MRAHSESEQPRPSAQPYTVAARGELTVARGARARQAKPHAAPPSSGVPSANANSMSAVKAIELEPK